MKPNTTQAMRGLIEDIKLSLPFSLNTDDICKDECKNCSFKLLEFIASEVNGWEYRLDNGEVPNFRDLSRLVKTAQKIEKALKKNGLIE